jgi:hypothetical protein
MKAFVANICSRRSITIGWVLLFFVAPLRLAISATFDQARVSQVIRDVRLLEANAASHTAVMNDKITLQNAVQTGYESRAELTFPARNGLPADARRRQISVPSKPVAPTTKITLNSKIFKFARELNRVTSNLERLLLLRRLVSVNYFRDARGQLWR